MKRLDCASCNIKSSAAKTLNVAELSIMGEHCSEVKFKKGETIFKENAFSSNIVYLKHGIVKIHIEGPNSEQIIKISKAPTYLGIPTTFDEKINRYSATALENTTVCFISLEMFKQFIRNNADFSYEIIVDLCKSELDSFNNTVNRAQKNISGRVADAILFFHKEIYKSKEFQIPISRIEFGNFVDTSRESVCRVLTDLDNGKIVKVRGKKITILDLELLKTISKNG
ncbi:MAG: Crp/Fnr family transcriptional regulator [Bacteroidales bacterium]|nr:Crp/Fnr family transcriptional regulator [Bacteroidales bacterium]MBN2756410.1 Crp/Fnr family transcriptional regulator [Bacteroidales bacterium]